MNAPGMVRATLSQHVLTLALARGEKRNALTPAMLAAWCECVREAQQGVQQGEVRCVLLTGEGEAFCAGFDLSLCQHDEGVLPALLDGLARCIGLLREVACPVVASAHGAAIAGGCAVLGACDVVVTHEEAKLGYPVLPLGVSPAVSAPTLAALAGFGAARGLLLGARVVSGREAQRLGVAHECVATREACSERAGEVARELAAKPAHALRATKAWLRELDGVSSAALGAALGASMSCVGSAEQQELLPRAWAKK